MAVWHDMLSVPVCQCSAVSMPLPFSSSGPAQGEEGARKPVVMAGGVSAAPAEQ